MGRVGPRRWASALGVVLLVLACPPAAAAAPPPAADPVRILVVGDSMTQGSSGDWTWRYRLWQHLAGHGVPVDFVGPRDDLWDNVTGLFGSHAYVDPAFDSDHAARWGRSMTLVEADKGDIPIGQLVTDYHPDVVVEMLGVNDLQFLGETVVDQRVTAVYFDGKFRVERVALYGIQDGKVFDFISRTTATGGKDNNFLGQLLTGVGKVPSNIFGGGSTPPPGQ